jgi:ATP-dependent Clp protease ATP-binding subunit ClpA
MALRLNADSEAARDLAKRCVPEGGVMGMGVLLQALFQGSSLKDRFPQFAPFLPEPEEHRKETPAAVPLAAGLKPVLTELADRGGDALTPAGWFAALLESQSGRDFAVSAGVSVDDLDAVLRELRGDVPKERPKASGGAGGWRESKERQQVVDALSTFGRMLTVGEPPQKGIVELKGPLESLFHAIVQRKQHSPLIIGLPGTGKSALVYEFARLLVTEDPFVTERLQDHDIFELSPIFLRSGASMVGQYEERVSSLLKVLAANPKVILFVDEAHSMFQSGMEHRGPFSDANEAFKQAIMNGELSLIGCTTTAEYRHYIEPDSALRERFTLVTIEPPSPEKTREIMRARRPMVEEYYGVEVPDDLIDRTVQLAEEYLLNRAQPRKSIQLLDGACAYCVIAKPPLEQLTEAELWRALEDTIGHSVVRDKAFNPDQIFEELRSKIIGQDEALKGISTAFVTGLTGWTQAAKKPRGVFLFSGPTGVGKTETSVLLSRILGGGKEAMLRVDCNTLKGSGHDGGPAQNVLFGPPPGYIGYVLGKGGVLSHIRDHPECIVLFDEIEKADPNVGELLFRIIDDGQCEDKEGNPLDFRRSFIVFTTNAGAVYHQDQSIGFGSDEGQDSDGPRTDHAGMRAHFARMGLGEPFLGRISQFFDFRGLDEEDAQKILQRMLEGFVKTSQDKGYALEWEPEVPKHLVLSDWQPILGAREVSGILRNRVMTQVVLADTQGELEGVKTIRLEVLEGEGSERAGRLEGMAKRTRTNDTLVISLA